MSNYTKTTDFASKDSLPSGDSAKIIKGAEFETEFDAIATSIATKADTAGPTFTGTVTIPTASVTTFNLGGTEVTATATELNYVDGVTSAIQTQIDTKAPTASPTFTGTMTVDNVEISAGVTVNGNSTDGTNVEIISDSANNAGPVVKVQSQRNNSNPSQTFSGGVILQKYVGTGTVASGDHVGTVYFGGNHTSASEANIAYGASISGVASGAFNSASDMPIDLVFYTGDVGQTHPTANVTYGTEALRIKADGDVTIKDGNLIIGTSGRGIDFSATSAAPGMTSELLDDYEEGTFTPTLEGSTTDPTVTYTTQSGRYTKIGNRVTCAIRVTTSAASGGVGNLRIGGLPFTANSSGGTVGLVGYSAGFGTNNFPTSVQINNSGSVAIFRLRSAADGTLSSTVNAANIGAAVDAVVEVTYETA